MINIIEVPLHLTIEQEKDIVEKVIRLELFSCGSSPSEFLNSGDSVKYLQKNLPETVFKDLDIEKKPCYSVAFNLIYKNILKYKLDGLG